MVNGTKTRESLAPIRSRSNRSVRAVTTAAAAAAAAAVSSLITSNASGAEAYLCGPPTPRVPALRNGASGRSGVALQRRHRTPRRPSDAYTLAGSSSRRCRGTGTVRSSKENDGHDHSVQPNAQSATSSTPLRAKSAPTSASGGALDDTAKTLTGSPSGRQREEEAGRQRRSSGRRRRPLGHITEENLDLIRASTSITEVISQHVEMKPAGRGMVGCCPFHDDRTPSFSVDETRGSYHCFGCGASGDVITFAMQIDGLGFREAVRELAEEAGISLDSDETSEVSGGARRDSGDEIERREARERLSLVLQMAAQFYTRCLVEMPAAGGARAHLLKRGISPMTVMDFQLGYSPADLTSPLIEYLNQEGFEMETLVDAGLIPDTSKWKYKPSSQNPRTRVDRFRGRLVVPIRDHRGTVIGFGARDLADSQAQGSVGSGFVVPEAPAMLKGKRESKLSPGSVTPEVDSVTPAAPAVTVGAGTAPAKSSGTAEADARAVGVSRTKPPVPPKYLNSPETALFKKGKNVFGLDLAKESIRSEDMAIVVEGYFDVMKLHDAGLRCAVGVLGTAITVDQLMLCARYSRSKRLVLCMDGDTAGQRAVERLCESPASSGLDSLAEAGVSISVASLPEESECKDPADFLQAHGVDSFRAKVVDTAVPWSNWYGDRIMAEHDFATDANAFRRCTDRLTGFISDLSIPTDQTFHVHRFARSLAQGNEVMQHQLEFDLAKMSNEKRARKNALRRRVARPNNPDTSTAATSVPQPSSRTLDSAKETPVAPSPEVELRRLTAGRAAEGWDVVVNAPRKAPFVRNRVEQGATAAGTPRDSMTRSDAAEGAEVLRNHEWVMERVKMRQREEARLKRDKYAPKGSTIWSPSGEQEGARLVFDDVGEPNSRDVVLRGRILDKAQRFLLALAVHDPVRRARCREEVERHGLSLGSEQRQWLFDAITHAAAAQAAEPADARDAGSANKTATHREAREQKETQQEKWTGPSSEALEAGGDMLFAEIRASAPGGYFALRGKARGRAARAEVKEDEERLDWVFDREEAQRIASASNADLVLLEVVMVMLKEQAAERMYLQSKELARTSDAIARTMAEAAAATFLGGPREDGATIETPGADGTDTGVDDQATPADASSGTGSRCGAGRTRAEAQAEVDRLKTRQTELFQLIGHHREEVAELEAQRRAFTSRLPKVRAESRAIRDEKARRASVTAASPSPAHTLSIAPEGASAVAHARGGDELAGGSSLSHMPMRFLDEDQDPDEGFDIDGVEAVSRAANAASDQDLSDQQMPPAFRAQHIQQEQDEERQRSPTQPEAVIDRRRFRTPEPLPTPPTVSNEAALSMDRKRDTVPGLGEPQPAASRGRARGLESEPSPSIRPTSRSASSIIEDERRRRTQVTAAAKREERRIPAQLRPKPASPTATAGAAPGYGSRRGVVRDEEARMEREAAEMLEMLEEGDDISGSAWA